MRLAWATDLHLEMASEEAVAAFCAAVTAAEPDVVLLGGDLATGVTLGPWLARLSDALRRPLYFVLGNHDYYRSEIARVRAVARRAADTDPRIGWLEETGAVALSESTALVGHGGWGDTGYGNPESPVQLNDFVLIGDLAGLPVRSRNLKLRALGGEAADHLRSALAEALRGGPREIVVLTHVPPFREACWHEGRLSNGDWLPFFACKATGDALLEVAGAHPDVRFTVLCGHTHSPGEAELLPNLRVSTGGAEYGCPLLARVFEVA